MKTKSKTLEQALIERLPKQPVTLAWDVEEIEQDAFSHSSGHYTQGTGEFFVTMPDTTYSEYDDDADSYTEITEENHATFTGPEAKKNSHVAACAPELLEALNECIKRLEAIEPDANSQAYAKACDAKAKAEGRA